jgi:hypothetical protein
MFPLRRFPSFANEVALRRQHAVPRVARADASLARVVLVEGELLGIHVIGWELRGPLVLDVAVQKLSLKKKC